MNGVETIREMIYRYGGDTWIVGIFLFCAISLYLNIEKQKRRYLQPFVVGGIVILTPIFQGIIQFMGGDGERYRFLWCFPVVLVIAGWTTQRFVEIGSRKEQVLLAIAMIGILFFAGNTYLKSENLALPENAYGIPDDAIEVSDIIAEDKEEAYVVAVLDTRLQLTIRQWDASIIWGITRETYLGGVVSDEEWDNLSETQREEQMLMRLVNYGEIFDVASMRKSLREKGIDYVVMPKDLDMGDYMEQIDCEAVGESSGYVVYRMNL